MCGELLQRLARRLTRFLPGIKGAAHDEVVMGLLNPLVANRHTAGKPDAAGRKASESIG
jgi:hypothetical protein